MTTTLSPGVETTLLGRKVRLYDLSQEVSQRTQMHPLHPRVEVYPFESHANSLAVLGTYGLATLTLAYVFLRQKEVAP